MRYIGRRLTPGSFLIWWLYLGILPKCNLTDPFSSVFLEPARSVVKCYSEGISIRPPLGTTIIDSINDVFAEAGNSLRLRAQLRNDSADDMRACTAVVVAAVPMGPSMTETSRARGSLRAWLYAQAASLARVGLLLQTVLFVSERLAVDVCTRQLFPSCIVLREQVYCGEKGCRRDPLRASYAKLPGPWPAFFKLWAAEHVLSHGYNVWLLDADVLVFRDPFLSIDRTHLLQAPLDGFERYTDRFHYFNGGQVFLRPTGLTLHTLKLAQLHQSVLPYGKTEQQYLNRAVVAVEDWLPAIDEGLNFSLSLPPVSFAQFLWRAPPVNSSSPAWMFQILADWLRFPGDQCEAKARRLVSFHANGAGKSAVTPSQLDALRSDPGAFPSIICNGMLSWRRAACRWAQIMRHGRIDGHGRLGNSMSFSEEQDEESCNLSDASIRSVWSPQAWDVMGSFELKWPVELRLRNGLPVLGKKFPNGLLKHWPQYRRPCYASPGDELCLLVGDEVSDAAGE